MLTSQNPNPSERPPFVLWRPFQALWKWLVPPTQAHIDRQSRTSRYVFLSLIMAGALALVVTAVFKGKDIQHGIKRWLSDRDAAEAVKYEDKLSGFMDAAHAQDYQNALTSAIQSANKAYTGDSDNPNAIRVLARLATRIKHNEARFLWDKLDKLHQLTDDDFAWRIQSLANLKEDKTANDQIEKLLKDSSPTRKVVDTADQVMQRLGRLQQLLDLLRNYSNKQPDDFDIRLLLGTRLVQLGNTSDRQEGRQILWELSDRNDEIGLHALEILEKQDALSLGDQKRLIDRLENHPLAKEQHHIAALRHLASLPGADKPGIIRKAIADHAEAQREDLVPLCRWLLDEGEYTKVADFLGGREDMLRDYTPLLDYYLTALTKLQRYTDLERLVEDPGVRLTQAERAFHRVHLAYVTGKSDEILDKLLVDAIASAINQNRIPMLLDLGRYAELRKHYRAALDAFKAASVGQPTERDGYEGMLRVSYLMGSMKEFGNTAREAARRWPDNPFYSERHLYACLLSGLEMETSIAQCRKLYDARPNDSQRKLLMGLACHRMADGDACRHAVEGLSLDDLTPGQRAVLCGLIQSLGFTKQAQEIANPMPDGLPMLPEEANFLRRVKQSATVAAAPVNP